MNYYFLAASLPMLEFGAPPPCSSQEFRQICADNLTTRDMRALKDLHPDLLDQPTNDPFVHAWRQTEICIRNTIAAERAARLHSDPAPFRKEIPHVDVDAERQIHELFAHAPSPLERERGLDLLRWNRLDELAGFNPFSKDAILAYFLKLKLAERWAGLDQDLGREQAAEATDANPDPEPATQQDMQTTSRRGEKPMTDNQRTEDA